MDSKRKIVELLRAISKENCFGSIEGIADHLVENGVTAQPCNVGDTVWTNLSISGSYLRKKDRPYACNVLFVGLNQSASGGFVNVEYERSGYQFQFDFDQFGKAVFHSSDEAKSELSEVSDDVLQP